MVQLHFRGTGTRNDSELCEPERARFLQDDLDDLRTDLNEDWIRRDDLLPVQNVTFDGCLDAATLSNHHQANRDIETADFIPISKLAEQNALQVDTRDSANGYCRSERRMPCAHS